MTEERGVVERSGRQVLRRREFTMQVRMGVLFQNILVTDIYWTIPYSLLCAVKSAHISVVALHHMRKMCN